MTNIEILPFDGSILYYPNFYSNNQAEVLFKDLKVQLSWEQKSIAMWGKNTKLPRLTAWHGDPECLYFYSKIRNIPSPWTNSLQSIRNDLQEKLNLSFNGVLGNFYTDGLSSISYHRDLEKALVENYPIVSLSFGEKRKMLLKHLTKKHKKPITLWLNSGDLLIQSYLSQKHWYHGVPKDPSRSRERINLTFRSITPFSELKKKI